MSVRDKILPNFDLARAQIATLGLRRFAVILRRRVWSGARIGDMTPTNTDLVLIPTPRVRFKSPFAAQMSGVLASGGSLRDRYYQVDKITPAYVKKDGSIGGYTPQQLRLRSGPDQKNVESVAVLIGDDGMARECSQVIFEDDRSFGYSMTLQELDKASTSLVSIVITAVAPLAPGATKQMHAVGSFNDGGTYDITTLVKWAIAPGGAAKVDVTGLLTALSDGTVNLNASVGRIVAPTVVVTVAG